MTKIFVYGLAAAGGLCIATAGIVFGNTWLTVGGFLVFAGCTINGGLQCNLLDMKIDIIDEFFDTLKEEIDKIKEDEDNAN